MQRTFWLLGPTLYGFLIYLLVLIGLMILDVFGKSFLAYALLLLFGPLFAWVTILAVVGVYMERRYLRPARKAWQVLRPPSPRWTPSRSVVPRLPLRPGPTGSAHLAGFRAPGGRARC